MGNSWVRAEKRDIPQPGSVTRENRLKTRFLHKHKRQGVEKGKIHTLARAADIKNTAQSSQRGLKRAFLCQKRVPGETGVLHFMAWVGASCCTWLTHHFSQSECHLKGNYSLSSSSNSYQNWWWENQRKASEQAQCGSLGVKILSKIQRDCFSSIIHCEKKKQQKNTPIKWNSEGNFPTKSCGPVATPWLKGSALTGERFISSEGRNFNSSLHQRQCLSIQQPSMDFFPMNSSVLWFYCI